MMCPSATGRRRVSSWAAGGAESGLRTPQPPDDRLRPHQDQVPAPVAPEAPRQHPAQPVAPAQPGLSPGGAGQHRQLVAYEQVLGDEVGSVGDGAPKRRQQECKELGHGHRMPVGAPGPLPFRTTAPLHLHSYAGGTSASPNSPNWSQAWIPPRPPRTTGPCGRVRGDGARVPPDHDGARGRLTGRPRAAGQAVARPVPPSLQIPRARRSTHQRRELVCGLRNHSSQSSRRSWSA